MTTDVATLTYVYGITWAEARAPRGVDLIRHGDIAAVATPTEAKELRAKRRDLLRHADVLQQVFEHATVLPLRFGVVLEDVVGGLLEPRHDELVQRLRALDGLAEMTVRATYREDDLLRAVLREEPALARMRGRAPALELGEAVARAVAARRDADAQALVRAVHPHVRGVELDEPRTELELVRAAFLVERGRVADVDRAVAAFADAHRATTSFRVTGPLPPYHFVQLAERA